MDLAYKKEKDPTYQELQSCCLCYLIVLTIKCMGHNVLNLWYEAINKLNLMARHVFNRHPAVIRKNQLSLKMLGVSIYLISHKNLRKQEYG